jgi:hypothetical protein
VQSDARALRVVLSLTGVKEGLQGHIVVEISDLDNEPLVKLVGGDLVETVVAHDVIGRLMIQCARHPGLAEVLLSSLLGALNSTLYLWCWLEVRTLCTAFSRIIYELILDNENDVFMTSFHFVMDPLCNCVSLSWSLSCSTDLGEHPGFRKCRVLLEEMARAG